MNYAKNNKDISPDCDVRIYTISHSGSDRLYIGATRKSLKDRLQRHKYRATLNNKRQKRLSFKDRWIVNAISNGNEIIIEELDIVKFSEFSFWERYYISLFKFFGFKLTNGTDGGAGVWPRKVSDEEIENLKILKSKPVVEYNRNGDIINRFDSLTNLSKETGLSISRLGHSVRGEKKLCANRMFRYEHITITMQDVKKAFYPRGKERQKRIIQYDLNGNFVAEYESVAHTIFNSPTQKSAIAKACRGECKTKYGFIWKYKNN